MDPTLTGAPDSGRPVTEADAGAPGLEIAGTPSSPADHAVTLCTGKTPKPGTPLRQVNLCDLLVDDAQKKLDKPARYEIISAEYADIRPTWSSGNASLCAGEEVVLRLRKFPESGDAVRECLQLRCSSSFPPAPLRVGKNGEFCRSEAGQFLGWKLYPTRVEAHYDWATDVWHLTEIGERYEFIRR